jgi:hypothetical protein
VDSGPGIRYVPLSRPPLPPLRTHIFDDFLPIAVNDPETLRVLAAHATALANDPSPMGHYTVKVRDDPQSPIGLLEHAFDCLIDVLEVDGFRRAYRRGSPPAVEMMAYREFWNVHRFYQDSLGR